MPTDKRFVKVYTVEITNTGKQKYWYKVGEMFTCVLIAQESAKGVFEPFFQVIKKDNKGNYYLPDSHLVIRPDFCTVFAEHTTENPAIQAFLERNRKAKAA